ncbi:YwiC-like family protein [Mannheimia sp. AT1]|uniref:YwiC-like family protein n=1 Tax=Mannheimia cairinae TaxID=3025936 RepID=A0ABT5MN72_9PAST|nr:YwiC-like family protein [Mannheimia cairinae]MDD0823624.1 YwiC-like family protein [Mannheimia cairinae]MDD0825444.1 YwiC-like family protein [Mannheimia cairinae]
MLNDKPVISNQHGALAMAILPFFYGVIASRFIPLHIFFGLSWLALYFFSYPFLSLFSKKPTVRNKKWAKIYFILSLVFALPVIYSKPAILQFLLIILPLGLIQIYFAKQKDERNLWNDIAGILTFGVIGMASFYLVQEEYNFYILLHPTLFFIATTFYVKSMVRERRNPIYMEISIGLHLLFAIIYALFSMPIFFAYLVALARAIIVPSLGWNVKQVGMLEFPVILIFLICLIW